MFSIESEVPTLLKCYHFLIKKTCYDGFFEFNLEESGLLVELLKEQFFIVDDPF